MTYGRHQINAAFTGRPEEVRQTVFTVKPIQKIQSVSQRGPQVVKVVCPVKTPLHELNACRSWPLYPLSVSNLRITYEGYNNIYLATRKRIRLTLAARVWYKISGRPYSGSAVTFLAGKTENGRHISGPEKRSYAHSNTWSILHNITPNDYKQTYSDWLIKV